jgi:hypothetical protein
MTIHSAVFLFIKCFQTGWRSGFNRRSAEMRMRLEMMFKVRVLGNIHVLIRVILACSPTDVTEKSLLHFNVCRDVNATVRLGAGT